MKTVTLAASLAAAFSSLADTSSLENFSPQFSTNTQIIWQAPTNHLPKSFWTYKKLSPHVFPETVISNAIVLASFQSKGFPKPSTNDTCIMDDPDCNCPCMRVCNFYIGPASAVLSFSSPGQNTSTRQLPSDQAIVKWAWNDAALLGIDPALMAEKCLTSHFNLDTNDHKITNQICGRGAFLSRQLDGTLFIGNGDDGGEGFWIEFGSYGQINSFFLNWPELDRYDSHQTANPEQIINCIRAHKIIVFPNADEEKYFERVKALANAKTFTITKITPYYGEGRFGETPADNEPPKWVTPVAEVEAVADFGNTNATVRMLSPILASDVTRLLTR
jgi:hypothetical protein